MIDVIEYSNSAVFYLKKQPIIASNEIQYALKIAKNHKLNNSVIKLTFNLKKYVNDTDITDAKNTLIKLKHI